MFDVKKCPIYEKIASGAPLSESERKLLAEIVKEEIKFLLRNQILPTPKEYERWFYIFCNLIVSKQKFEDNVLIELYSKVYEEENLILDIKADFEYVHKVLSDIIDELQKYLKESYRQASIEEQKLTQIQKDQASSLEEILRELLSLVSDLKRTNEEFLKEIETQKAIINELKAKLKTVEAEANLDPLTDLFNRRSLERALEDFFSLCKKSKISFSLVLIDLDNFKHVNDNYGHNTGDVVLVKVAKMLRTSLRAKDIVGRWGGDEFIVILPNTSLENARKIIERIKSQLEKMEVLAEGRRFKTSISAGVVECGECFQTWMDMVKEADRLMYEDKKSKKV